MLARQPGPLLSEDMLKAARRRVAKVREAEVLLTEDCELDVPDREFAQQRNKSALREAYAQFDGDFVLDLDDI